MDPQFWHERWQSNEIGFHEGQANHLLVKYIDQLMLKRGDRVFLPLCGKTRDIAWLLSQDYRVAGIELSRAAVEQLFDELGVTPMISQHGELSCYQAEGLSVFVGDFFNLTADILGVVDAVYDRAALVAMPDQMRERYTAHLLAVGRRAPQLLISFDYDQSQMPGPPFSVPAGLLDNYYQTHYQLKQLDAVPVPGGLKGQCDALEVAWLLTSG